MVVNRDVYGNETCIWPEPPPLNQPGYGLGGTVQGEAFNLTACSSVAISAYQLQWNIVHPFYRLLLNFKDAMLAFDSFNRSVYGDFADPRSILHAESDMSALQCRNRVARSLRPPPKGSGFDLQLERASAGARWSRLRRQTPLQTVRI